MRLLAAILGTVLVGAAQGIPILAHADEAGDLATIRAVLKSSICNKGMDGEDALTYGNKLLVGAFLDVGLPRTNAAISVGEVDIQNVVAPPKGDSGMDVGAYSPVTATATVTFTPSLLQPVGQYWVYAPVTPFVVLSASISSPLQPPGMVTKAVTLAMQPAPLSNKDIQFETPRGGPLPAGTVVSIASPIKGPPPTDLEMVQEPGGTASWVTLKCVNLDRVAVYLETDDFIFDGIVELTAKHTVVTVSPNQ